MHDIYREHIIEHYKHPQNYGRLQDPDAAIDDLNSTCGDRIHLEAKYQDGRIAEIAFESEGCAISRASASLLTEDVKNTLAAEVEKLKAQDVYDLLGVTVGPGRVNCALLPLAALKKLVHTPIKPMN